MRPASCTHVSNAAWSVIVVTGLQADVLKFLIFFLDLFLTTTSAASISFVAGASVNSFGFGQVVLVMVFVFMMVRSSSDVASIWSDEAHKT